MVVHGGLDVKVLSDQSSANHFALGRVILHEQHRPLRVYMHRLLTAGVQLAPRPVRTTGTVFKMSSKSCARLQ